MASNNAVLEAAKSASANFPSCPKDVVFQKYHQPEACLSKPNRPPEGHPSRHLIYQRLLMGGTGASLVPNEETRLCPIGETETLESPTAIQGFDTTWIVENTSSKVAVVAWVVNGVEVSPFEPGLSPMDDPKCLLQPGGTCGGKFSGMGSIWNCSVRFSSFSFLFLSFRSFFSEWISVPTFESYVYHVREIDKNGPGRLVLQHRAGTFFWESEHEILITPNLTHSLIP